MAFTRAPNARGLPSWAFLLPRANGVGLVTLGCLGCCCDWVGVLVMDLQQGELGGHVTVGWHLSVRVVDAPWGGTGDARHGTGYDTSCFTGASS